MAKEYICQVCQKVFHTSSSLSHHKYDIHSYQVKVVLGEETSVVEKTNGKFKCPDCPSKLLNPKTFNQHLKTHGGSCSAKSSKQDKPVIDEDENATSVDLQHRRMPSPQVDIVECFSNSFSVHQNDKSIITNSSFLNRIRELGYTKNEKQNPIFLLSKSGKKYYMFASPETTEHLMKEQPTGVWKLQ